MNREQWARKIRVSNIDATLEQIYRGDEVRIADPGLDKAQIDRLLETAPQDVGPTHFVPCIHEMFEEQVSIKPDSVAVKYAGRTLTYAELNAKANRLAHYLKSQGVNADDRIGLLLQRSFEMVIGVMGILKAGAAYVPLSPEDPPLRLQTMLADAQATIVVTGDEFKTLLSECNVKSVSIHVTQEDAEWNTHSDQDLDRGKTGLGAQNLAYVLYTSGSTGKPKGVMVPHLGVVNYLRHCEKAFFAELVGSVVSNSLSFDATVTSFLVPLICGRWIEMLPQDKNEIQNLAKILKNSQENLCFKFTPAHLSALDSILESGFCSDVAHQFIVGGEQMSVALASRWQYEKFPQAYLVNHFGPTEAIVGCSTYQFARRAESSKLDHMVPIGTPITNAIFYILDEEKKPVEPGVDGELYVGGIGLAKGYLNRPELTETSFLKDPFSQVASGNMYKTGDLVHKLGDGNYVFLGRIDHQVKIRGFRIELGEIEAALNQIDWVKDSLVIVRGDPKKLVAYLRLEERADWEQIIRAELKRHLPDYMLPVAYVCLDSFPLKFNGKVDRDALPEPDFAELISIGYVPPETEVERVLCNICAKVLKLDKVGVTDNFFSIGGDSILMLQLVYHANQAGVPLTTQAFFRYQSIREVGVHLGKTISKAEPQADASGEQQLLPIQLDFFAEDPANQQHYNQCVLVETPPGFNLNHLKTIVGLWYQLHDVFRLSFKQEAQEWVGRYRPLHPLMIAKSVGFEQLGKLPEADYVQKIFQIAKQNQTALALEAGPLLRAVYMDIPEKKGRLLLIIHHLVVDGISWRVLIEQLEQFYKQLQRSEAVEVPQKLATFQQWGRFVKSLGDKSALQQERNYWQAQLEKPHASLPVDKTVLSKPTHASTKQLKITLSATGTKALLNHCQRAYNTQINDLLLSALWLNLYRWSGDTCFLIKLEGHGREDLGQEFDLSKLVGWFTSVFPLALKSASDVDVGAVIMDVKERLRSMPNRGVGFGILRQLGDDAELKHLWDQARPSIAFNYLGRFDKATEAEAQFTIVQEDVGATISEQRQRSQSLGLNGIILHNQLTFHLDYSELEYAPQTMESFLKGFEAALLEIIEHCLEKTSPTYTQSDFPLVKVSRDQLSDWQRQYPFFEDLYPSTPMQKGLLFHTHLDRSAYVNQIYMHLQGDLDMECFRKAWINIVQRHAVFRSVFVGEELMQLVLSTSEPEWLTEDWSHLDSQEQESQFENYRAQDKEKGFNPDGTTLLRLSLIRLGASHFRFLWSIHHALMDGWCLPIIFREVLSSYSGFRNGITPSLTPAPTYKSYIEWLQTQDETIARNYWQDLLKDIRIPTTVSLDKRALESTQIGADALSMHLDVALTQALRRFAQDNQITLNILVQAVWSYFLYRLLDQQQIIFGETVAGRPAELTGIQEMVGLFINTLPVKVAFDESQEIVAWLRCLHEQSGERNQHAYLSLPTVQKLSALEKNPPLFDTLVVFENYPVEGAEETQQQLAKTFTIEKVQVDEQTNYRLTLNVSPRSELELKIIFRREEYSRATVLSILEYLQAILKSLLDPACKLIKDLPAVPNAGIDLQAGASETSSKHSAQDQALSATNQGLSRASQPASHTPAIKNRANQACVHEIFESWVERTPEAVAAEFEDVSISYRQLNRGANYLASQLISSGIGRGDLVGIYLERSFEMLIAVLGVLKSGAAYVPLDPKEPFARLNTILNDANVVALILSPQLDQGLPLGSQESYFRNKFFVESSAWQEPHTQALSKVSVGVDLKDPAYVIYTSGSTGKPKGVVVPHQGVVNYLKHCTNTYFNDVEGAVLSSSLSFDATVTSLLGPLTSGKYVKILPQDGNEIGGLAELLVIEERDLVFKITPAHLAALERFFPGWVFRRPHASICGWWRTVAYQHCIALERNLFPTRKLL